MNPEEKSIDPTVDKIEDDQPSKRARVDDGDDNRCVLCSEESSEVSPLQSHSCKQCTKDAWKICLVCNEGILSRTCPICRGEYAPLVMHLVPGPPLKKLADSSLSVEERTKLLYKFGVVRQVIARSNVVIWSDAAKKMFFSLPQSIGLKDNEAKDISYSVVAVPIEEKLVEGNEFLFTNSIWDLIENEVEHGEVHAGQEVTMQEAMNIILAITKEEDHKLFTMMTPQDWEYMMNPGESVDTSEALRIIRNSIVEPLLNVVPSSNEKSDKE